MTAYLRRDRSGVLYLTNTDSPTAPVEDNPKENTAMTEPMTPTPDEVERCRPERI